MVDGLVDGEAGEQTDGAFFVFGVFGEEAVHVEAVGEFVEKFRVPGFLEEGDVGIREADHFGQRIDAAGAAFEDVVGEEAHGVEERSQKSVISNW